MATTSTSARRRFPTRRRAVPSRSWWITSRLSFVYQRDAIASGPTQQVEIGDYALTSPLVGVPAYDPTTRMVYVSNSADLTGGEYRHGLLAFSVGTDCQLHLSWQQ